MPGVGCPSPGQLILHASLENFNEKFISRPSWLVPLAPNSKYLLCKEIPCSWRGMKRQDAQEKLSSLLSPGWPG